MRLATGGALLLLARAATAAVAEREEVIAQLARAVHDFFLFWPAS